MKLKDLKWAALTLAILASCSDKKDVDNPEGPQGSGTMEVMTPAESKVFLQDAATEFLGKFNPEDQREIIELAGYFDETYADFELPANFYPEDEKDEPYYSPRNFIKELAKAANGDADALTRAANSYSITYKFENFAGVYKPNNVREEWVKDSDSKDIIFRFSNAKGQPVELKITQSGGTSDIDFSVIDWDYDYVDGNYVEIEETWNYYLQIPKTIEATLTSNGTTLAETKVESAIDVKNHTLYANVDAKMNNLRLTARINGTDTKVEAKTEIYTDGKDPIGTAYVTITGNDLCNREKYESMEDMTEKELDLTLEQMFKNGECGVDALGKVQAYAQMKYYREIRNDLDVDYDKYEFYDKSTAKTECENACVRLNNNIQTQLRYNNTKTDQASIKFVCEPEDEDTSYWSYSIYPYLLFPDGTSYKVDNYFDNFTSVANKWESLWSAYERIWDQAKRK